MEIIYSEDKKVLESAADIYGQFIVPDSVESIESFAFEDCENLTSIVISGSVNEIGYNAFGGCINLEDFVVSEDNSEYTSVDGILYTKDMSEIVAFPPAKDLDTYEIPDTVCTIGDAAFMGCVNLESVIIPDSVDEIGECAFENCENLESILISESVTVIKTRTFANCTSLNNVILPESIEIIESEAFESCHGLDSISIPDSITELGSNAFGNCSTLESVFIPDSVTQIGMFAFAGCIKLSAVIMSNSVELISHGAFASCVSLMDIDIPDTVKFIGSRVFADCRQLKSICCKIENLEALLYNDDAFDGCDLENCVLFVPADMEDEYREHPLFSQFGIIANEDEISLDEEDLDEGYDSAQELVSLAIDYYNGNNFEKAFECYEQAAQLGHVVAQCNLAFLYKVGQGIERNMEQAVYWYTKSAEQGSPQAQENLADMMMRGEGMEPDYSKAIEWLKKAAASGMVNSQYTLGIIYIRGEWVKPDLIMAKYWLKKAADQGMDIAIDALKRLGSMVASGVNEEQNETSEIPTDMMQEYLKVLVDAAENGDMDAQYNLACAYNDGDPATGEDYEKAFRYFLMAAEQGHMEAQCNLGVQYLYGYGIEQDFEEGKFWLEKAAEQGDDVAVSHLERLSEGDYDYYNREFSPSEDRLQMPNFEADDLDEYESESMENLNNASQTIVSDEYIFTAEEAMACFCVGAAIVKHEDMQLVPPGIFMLSYNEKFLIYKDLMMWAVYLLGIKSESNWTQIYADADDPNRLSEALKLISQFSGKKKTCASVFLRTIAGSDADEANSERRILKYHNYCIECGLREIIDGEIAQRLNMKMTIYNGYDYMWDNYAEYLDEDDMADCIENDEEFDPEYDLEEEYDEANDSDFDDAESQLELAGIYIKEGAYEEAVKCLIKAAEQNHANAQTLLGLCYYNGEGVNVNYEEAVKWFEKAATNGNAEGQLNLGLCYSKGHGVEQDADKAFNLFKKSAEQGNAEAQCNIATCYLQGLGVIQNKTLAVDWYRKSADQGEPDGQYGLGFCMVTGWGIKPNIQEGKTMLRMAAEQEHKQAQALLDRLNEKGL